MCSNIIPCPLCSQPAFSNSDSLRLALVSVATRHLSCPVCSELFLGLDKLTIHMFGHLHGLVQEKPLKMFTTPNEMLPAVPNYIITPILGTQQYPDVKKELPKVTVPQFACDICGFKFNDRKIVDMHKSLVHANIAVDKNGEQILPCHLCTKKFRMKGSLMIHLRVAHFGFANLKSSTDLAEQHSASTELISLMADSVGKDLPASFSCNVCGKTFLKQQQLTVHLKTHDNKQWECDVCSKMFTTKYFLKKHKRLHTGEMPYNCNQCNKSFTFQQSYHKHMLYHSSDKPHVCGQCGRAFKELSTLHNHERIHSGERPFSCEICGKSFRQRVSCLVHRRIHTGAMPYHCTACGKKFRYKVSQRTHKCPAQPPGTVVRSESNQSPAPLPSPINYDEANTHLPAYPQPAPLEAKEEQLFEKIDSTQNHLEVIKNTDFFSLVMSPMNVLSPSEKLQHLCLSSTPPATQDPLDVDKQIMEADDPANLYESLCCDSDEVDGTVKNSTLQNDSLQTINEESLKQLLYGP